MGRPLRKDVNGVDVIGWYGDGTPGEKQAGIKVEGFFAAEGGYANGMWIKKQRGAKTYVVYYDDSTFYTGTLVSRQPQAEGEIRILGSLDGTSPGTVAIAKLTKRVATDFSGNRYTWYLSQYADSTGDVIVLTPISR